MDKNNNKIKNGQKHVKLSEHASMNALDAAFKKSTHEGIYKVVIPSDIDIGYKFYNQNGQLVGEVVNSTKDMWYVKRPKDKEPIDFMILKKDSIEQKFIDQYFVFRDHTNISEN